jgi:hypothetical protein
MAGDQSVPMQTTLKAICSTHVRTDGRGAPRLCWSWRIGVRDDRYPTLATKTSQGWGTHFGPGADEEQKQQQPQILRSALHPSEQKTLAGDPAEKRFAQDDTVWCVRLFRMARCRVCVERRGFGGDGDVAVIHSSFVMNVFDGSLLPW